MTRQIVWLLLLAGCSAGQLERIDNSPLTKEQAAEYNAEATTGMAPDSQPQPVYTRFDLGKMSIVNLGVVVDSRLIDLTGTVDTGWRVGAAAGALNSINSGTTSTESILVRILGGALVGAAIESSLTDGQAYEYLIRRDDGKLISTLNRSRLGLGDCLMIRTDPSNSNTLLELKNSALCDQVIRPANGYSVQQANPAASSSTKVETRQVTQVKAQDQEVLVGRWCDKQVPSMPIYNGILEIVELDSGAIELRRSYGDGSSGTSALIRLDEATYALVDSASGDKFRTKQSDGDLELLDDEGFIRLASQLTESPRQGECGF